MFDWNKFKNENIVVHCKTEELKDNFIDNLYVNDLAYYTTGCKVRKYLHMDDCKFSFSKSTMFGNGIVCLTNYRRDYEVIEWEYQEIKGKDILKIPYKHYCGLDSYDRVFISEAHLDKEELTDLIDHLVKLRDVM